MEQKYKYESVVGDYHGHVYRSQFFAKNDQEAIQIFNDERGMGYGTDTLFKVHGEFADYSHSGTEAFEKAIEQYEVLLESR